MKPTTSLYCAVAFCGAGSALLAQATGAATGTPSLAAEPWWIAAIVVPLAGFAAWLVHWILSRQEVREAAIAERDKEREKREDGRAEQVQLQTRAMQECVTELRRLNEQQTNLPDRIVERLRDIDALKRPA